jgi:LmbE family N-acetylglucosaminyl deacetylase
MKRNIFISPHLDDVVLSCGEYLKKLSDENENITVLTVFAGSPDPSSFSEIAKNYHKKCQLDDDAVFTRQKEDKNAMKYFDADFIHLDLYEALYRMDKYNQHKYKKVENIFTKDTSNELDTTEDVKEAINQEIVINEVDNVYLPLGLGEHIDHVITSKALTELMDEEYGDNKIYYYEDVPYSYNLMGSQWDIDYMCDLNGKIFDIKDDQWKSKLIGINFYKSQVRSLWKNEAEKIYQLNTLSYQLAYGKRKIRMWQKVKIRVELTNLLR